jgi:hypothetical protein
MISTMSQSPHYADLSGIVDFEDSFNQGNQIHSFYRNSNKHLPTWMKDDAAIQKILLQVFPKLEVDKQQRRAAGRWAQVIQIYFRMNQPAGVVARQMAISIPRVRSLVRSIYRASLGLTTRGTERKRSGAGRPVGSKTDKSKETFAGANNNNNKSKGIKPKSRKRRVANPLTGAERVTRFRRRQQLAGEIEKISQIIKLADTHKIDRIDPSIYLTLRKLLHRLYDEKATLDEGRRYPSWKTNITNSLWERCNGYLSKSEKC